MPNIYARSARTGKLYSVNIAGTQPTPEEQSYIEQRIDNLEGFGATEAPLVETEAQDTGGAGELISGFGRGFLTSFTELPQGVVGLGESVFGYEPGSTAIGEAAQDISKAGREGVEYMLGQSDGSVSAKTGEAFGSLASFLVPGTAAAKAAKLAGAGLKAQKVSGLVGVGAMGTGLGASEQINRVANQLSQGKQVDPEDFINATRLGGVIGASEILPFQRVLGDVLQVLRKVPKQSQEEAIKTIGGRLKRALKTGTAEGLQEAAAGIAQDLVEQNLYNPEANIGATSDEEFMYGGGAGAALSFLVDSIRGRQLNKMDAKYNQLKDDLDDEAAETAEKAKFAANSLQSEKEFEGGQKLLAPPSAEEEVVEEGVPDITKRRLESLGTTPQEEAVASAQAARERTTGFSNVELVDLPMDEAAVIRRKRISTGQSPDEAVSLEELRSTIGEAAFVREYKKQKPMMWRESPDNPRNKKSFSFEQYDRAVEAVKAQNKATVPVIQAAAKIGKDAVPLSVVREIQQELSRKGVIKQVDANRWAVITPEEGAEAAAKAADDEDDAAPIRKTHSEIERRIDEINEQKIAAQEARDQAKSKGDDTVVDTISQQIAEADRQIDNLNNQRNQLEARINQIDPQNPLVRSIDDAQRQSNAAREVSEAAVEQPLTDEYARKRQSVANALRRYLNTLGLGNRVDLVTQNVIMPENVDKEAKFGSLEEQLTSEGIIEGFEQAGENGRRVIALAMEIYDPNLSEQELALKLRGVMNHEMIHALRGLGLFTDAEWKTLSKAAESRKRVRYIGGRLQEREYTYYDRAEAIYGPMGADNDLIVEEAVAEMFRDYVDGKLKVAGKPQSLFKRIIGFFKSIFRAHNDAGFKQAADIFQNIITTDKSKQIGRRETQTETNFDDSNVANDNFRKTSRTFSPDRSIKAYKVVTKGQDGKLYPLFVDASTEIPVGEWVEAATPFTFEHNGRLYVPSKGAIGGDGKRKKGTGVSIPIPNKAVAQRLLDDGYISNLNTKTVKAVAARMGFHAGSLPIANHIGKEPKITPEQRQVLIENGYERSIKGQNILNIREDDQVWAEVLVPDNSHGVDWQEVANSRAGRYPDTPENRRKGRVGEIKANEADINDQLPIGGHYLYRQGAASKEESWVISGNMLVLRELSREEVRRINAEQGVKDSPTIAELEEMFGPREARRIVYGDDKKYSVSVPSPIGGISQFLTEQEIEETLIGGKSNVEKRAERIAQIFRELPSAENFAAVAIAGQAKKGWYRNSARAIMEIFGIYDARRFTALLAATSPQTSVESNAINTLSIWANWNKAGRPQDRESILRIMGESVQGNKGKDSILPAWVNNSIRALTAPFGQEMNILLSGPKVNSFMLNLVNELDEVTNDTWMANFALLKQDMFASVERAGFADDVGKIGIKGPGYLAFSARVRQAAQAASELTGDSWAPAEIQETVWSLAKALLEKRKRLRGNMRGMTAKDLLKEGVITDQQVADVPDFATLFTDGVYGRILEDAGYKEQLDAVRSSQSGAGIAIQPRPVYSAEGVSVNSDFIRRELGEFADRLEILAVNGKKALRKLSTTIPANIQGGRRAAINVRIGAGFNGRVFDQQRGSRTLNGYNIVSTYTLGGNAANTYSEQDVSVPMIMELEAGQASGEQFKEAIDNAKASLGEFGESVYVYPVKSGIDEDGYPYKGYEEMRLFLTEDGTSGFALKPTDTDGVVDIVSVFTTSGSPNKQINYPMIRLATEQGGNTLDAFDIYLPKLYSANGFKVRSRLKWDDSQAPDGWDKEAFKNYNNGEPDVVFMYYQPDRIDVYEQGSDEGELFDDYMEAVNAQVGAALSNRSVNRYRDAAIAEAETENNPEEFLSDEDNAQLEPIRETVDKAQKYDGTKLSITPPGPNAFIKAPLKTKEQYEYGYINDRGRKVPVHLTYGQHVVLDDGREAGYGLKHMQMRGHVDELINAGFPSAEKALFDLMYRWGAQGFRDGPDVVGFPDGGFQNRDLRLEWDAGKKGKIIASLKYGTIGGQPLYVFRTAYPKTTKKLSLAYSAIDPNRIQNQIPVAQNSLMYSRASNLLARVLGTVYERNKAEDIAENFLQKFQDSMLPVGRMIDELKAQGATITDAMDTYLREELYHGVTGSKIADNEKNLYEPMLELVKGINLTEAQVDILRRNSRFVREALQAGKPLKQVLADAFLYARHAQERNAYIRSIDPENESGSGMTDNEARAINNFFDSLDGVERQRFVDIGLAADEIVKNTNDIRVASGLTPDFNDGQDVVNAETGEVVSTAPNYNSYVPLRGILDPENEANEEYSGRPSSRPKFGARGREDQRALGRFEFAKDIMANLMVQNQNAIVRAERNRVGQSFLEILRNEPNLTSSYARIVTMKPVMRVLSNGVVRTRPDPRFKDRDDILIVKEGGQEVYIEIDDPRIALAMRGASGMSPQHTSMLVKALGKVNRYLSNINTSWNPEFLITNMVRDLQTAGVNINQYEMNGLTSDALKSIPSALKGIKRSIVDKDDASEWAQIYRDFVRAGGQNATNQMADLSDQLERLQDMLNEVSEAGSKGLYNGTKSGFKKILNTLENYNTVVENGVRVSTYKALLDRGFSKDRAAQAARNVTVNFAKGGEYKTFMNSMYLFYNASLQGSFALLNAAARSGKVRKLWVGATVMGLLMDQLNSMISDDDEDGKRIYDKIPDYVLEKNLILMDPFGVLPSERGYFKIPLPYGLNMALNMGRSLSRAGRGGYTPSEATSSLVGTILDTLNPIGDTPRIPLIDKDFEFQDILTTVSPSVTDPVVQYLTNSDYARKPIYKEPSSFGVPAPESQTHWTTTSPSAIFIANFLRKPFGLGDASDVRPGLIEVSPDTLEFWFDYATGGVGRFVQRTAEFGFSTAPRVISGDFEEEMLRATPALRQVVGSVSEREDVGSFVEKRDRVLLTRKDFIDARKKGDSLRADRIAEAYKEELRISGVINALNNARNKIIRKKKEVAASDYLPDSQKKVIIERMDERLKEIMIRANQIMSNI
jgi:RNA-binding protein YhbY